MYISGEIEKHTAFVENCGEELGDVESRTDGKNHRREVDVEVWTMEEGIEEKEEVEEEEERGCERRRVGSARRAGG